ncbi:ATP-binding protein [Streptomyces actuosus]|uniref:ATP-binding protein n=1 Tax=Streptomyces actuosus TaxID=1885 RepID=A0ABS2VJ25_STRAS|nr:ATP-binding protein [Streptomyces actuosus]MBN0043096.1 ATP-binding protein [Streptomyces actuosus]
MTDPQPIGSASALDHLNERLAAHLAARGLSPVEPGPIDDGPVPGMPGHPEFHRQNRIDFALARWRTATPPRYQHSDASHPDVKAWAAAVAAEPDAAGSLLITGTTGTGKTHQAYGALRLVAESGPRDFRMLATTAADMYGRLRPGGSERTAEDELKRLCDIPLLLLDDLGSAKASEWTEEITYRLINGRYNQCLPTVFTSNLPTRAPRDENGRPIAPDLAAALGERIVSRLAEMTTVVPMTGDDLRRRGAA